MSAHIEIGRDQEGRAVKIDLATLIVTRLLIQANSGGGKSWLIRRLVEQMFGKVQIIIIDVEGDFSTLREKFDFVLAGPGGETPADPRTAALLAHRLLKLHASAICDIYELPKDKRHEFVRNFLDAMVNAPKSLWHPVVIVVDEGHNFAPERGEGESVASNSMIELASKGRKRGFCLVVATQRPAKLRKDITAELLNVFVGAHFIDIDQDSAARTLGVSRNKATGEFFADLKTMEAGTFFALGRAITKSVTRFKVGEVQTRHPEAGSGKHAAAPPPTPEKIRGLLPQLSDIPQEAEKKAATEKELKAEIGELKRQLRVAPKQDSQPADRTVEREQVKAISALRRALEDTLKFIIKIQTNGFDAASPADQEAIHAAVKRAVGDVVKGIESRVASQSAKVEGLKKEAARVQSAIQSLLDSKVKIEVNVEKREPFQISDSLPERPRREVRDVAGFATINGDLTGPEQKILDAIARLESIGIEAPPNEQIAFVAGYSPTSSSYANPRGALKSRGYIDYPSPGAARLTAEGRLASNPQEPLDAEGLQQFALAKLAGPESKILTALLQAYPNPLTNEELAERSGYSPTSSSYANPRGALKSIGLVDYPKPGLVVANPLLFLENAR